MAWTVAALREATDNELIAAHDQDTRNMGVTASYYLDELRRRDARRAELATQRFELASYTLARRAYVLAWVTGVFAAVAAVAAVIALAH
jgi:hypothetical protein